MKNKNYIEVIYVDDNGLDHHVLLENLPPFKAPSAAQGEVVQREICILGSKMRLFLKSLGLSPKHGKGEYHDV